MVRDLSLPEPFSSLDCDLRGLEWMPLQTQDLLDSDLWLLSDGWEFKAAMGLICKSWRQVPAGSLPNDDRALATLAGVPDWTSVRTMALRNWVLCSDGRLYHPIVAAKAMEALPHRQEFVQKKTADADRKARERKDRKDLFTKLKAAGITPKWDTKTGELRDLVAKLDGQKGLPPAPAPVTEKPDLSRDLSRLRQGPDTTPPDTTTPSGKDNPPKPPRKRGSRSVDDLVSLEQLIGEGLQEQHAKDWLRVRKEKSLPLTPTAWAGVKEQAALAGLDLDTAIKTAVENSWGGFKAKWVTGDGSSAPSAARGVAAGGNRQTQLEDRNLSVGEDWAKGASS